MANFPIPEADATIADAVLAVLAFIERCKFTSINEFLLALFQSEEEPIRRRVGMMCSGRRPGFNDVLSCWMSDPRISPHIDSVSSEYSRRALEHVCAQMSSELSSVGKGSSGLRLPATAFNSYDWEDFDFDKLDEKFECAVPTVYRFIRFLCGFNSPGSIIPNQETPEPTPRGTPELCAGSEMDVDMGPEDDMEEDEDPEDLPEQRVRESGMLTETTEQRMQRKGRKRMKIATMVVGMITFSRTRRANIMQTSLGFFAYSSNTPKRVIAVLNRLGVTCSYETILGALRASAAGVKATTLTTCKDNPFLITYDNFDIYKRVQDERLHSKNILDHGTMGAVIWLRQQNGSPWVPTLPPPSQRWVRSVMLMNFTAQDLLHPVWKSMNNEFPDIWAYHISELFRKYSGAQMLNGRDLEPFKVPEIHKLAPVRVNAATLTAMDMNEGTLEGNASIIDYLLEELDIDREKAANDFLVPFSGDQLTVSRLRSLQYLREHDIGEHRLSWILPIAGLFHVKMACIRMIFEAHEGRGDGRDPISLRRFGVLLGRTNIYVAGGKTLDFHKAETLLNQVVDALLLSAVITKLQVTDLKGMQDQVAVKDWRVLIAELIKDYLKPQRVARMRAEEPPERDLVYENAMLAIQHGLMYRELSNSIKHGDTGRTNLVLQQLTVLFQGGKQSKYAIEMLEWSSGMLRTWSEELKQLWYNHCVVNLSGREGKFIATDHFNEHLVRQIVDSHNPRNSSAADKFLREVIAPNVLNFSNVKRKVAEATEAINYGSRHGEVSARIDVLRLVTEIIRMEAFIFQPGRNKAGPPANAFDITEATDLWSIGWAKLRSGVPIADMIDRKGIIGVFDGDEGIMVVEDADEGVDDDI